MMTVGTRAPPTMPGGDTSSLKYFLRIATPAGLGALAIMVSPPPATAPATTAYFKDSVKPGTSVLRKVIAALSLKA